MLRNIGKQSGKSVESAPKKKKKASLTDQVISRMHMRINSYIKVARSVTWPAMYDNCSRSKSQGHKVTWRISRQNAIGGGANSAVQGLF